MKKAYCENGRLLGVYFNCGVRDENGSLLYWIDEADVMVPCQGVGIRERSGDYGVEIGIFDGNVARRPSGEVIFWLK